MRKIASIAFLATAISVSAARAEEPPLATVVVFEACNYDLAVLYPDERMYCPRTVRVVRHSGAEFSSDEEILMAQPWNGGEPVETLPLVRQSDVDRFASLDGEVMPTAVR